MRSLIRNLKKNNQEDTDLQLRRMRFRSISELYDYKKTARFLCTVNLGVVVDTLVAVVP